MSKKSRSVLSVFLVVLMLLTSAPLQGFVGLELPDWFSSKAQAASNVTTYGIPAINGAAYTSSDGTAAYGTPVFDGTRDRWFLWQNGDDYTKVYYPSHIYLDVAESLESAGYNWQIEWVFGDGTDYRTFLGANIWGDHSQWSELPDYYYIMNNIFSDYAVDVSVPQGTDSDGGVYGRTSSSSNYDVRVVGYDYCSSEQGTDSFTYNSTTHSKYVMLRSRQDTNYAYLYLKGNPSSSYVGKTSYYSTEDYSFGGYGYAQKYSSGSWSTHESGSNVYYYKGDDSSYTVEDSEGVTCNEMAWKVTVYDKSALNTLINTAISMRDDTEQYTDAYRTKLASAITTAQAVLTKRATTQSEINKAKTALQAVVGATEKTACQNKVKVTAYVETYSDAAYATLQIYYMSADGTEKCMEKTLEEGTFCSGVSGKTITLYEDYIDGFPTKVYFETFVPSGCKRLRLEDFQLLVDTPFAALGITGLLYQPATASDSFEISSSLFNDGSLEMTQDVNIDGSFVEGACGDALTWTLNTAGVLEITGEGDMLNCSEYMINYSEYMSWDDLKDLISVVMIDSEATSICSDAFTGCTNLEIVKIPDTMTEIAENAFDDCTSLESVYYGGSEKQWNKLTESLENSPLTEATVYYNVDAGMCGKKVIGVLDNETNVLTIRGTGDMYPCFICDYVIARIDTRPWFSGYETIETVIIEEGVTSIGAYSFEDCENITEVEIPDSVTSIGGNSTFSGLKKLQTIDLPDSLSYIGYEMFSGCTSLSYIEIPDGVTYIGSNAFEGCTALTSVQLPEGVTTVYDNVFDGCTKLKTVILPDSLTSMGNEVFNGCTALVNVVLPDGLEEIGYSVFNGCTGLTEINYPSALITCNYKNSLFYWYGAFHGSSITSFSIPDGVTSIPAYTFSRNTSLTSIEIPATVTSIGNYAFYYCSSLTDVYFYGSEEQWNNISIGKNNGKLTGATVHFVKNYSAEAAAEYGKQYALSYNKEWPFYFPGGDCANFVSQAIFTSGYDMDGLWHSYDGNDGSNGNFWYDAYRMNNLSSGDKSVAIWIRAHELCDYLVSQGGELIYSPSASDFSLGDAVFYDWELDGEIDHSAIVTAIDNGVPKVSGHTTDESDSRLNTHWCYDYSSKNCYLVKLGGGTCYNTDGVAYDCYYVNTKTEIMSEPNGGSVLGYIKQYRTARVFEVTDGYGYFYYKGIWGWIDLSDCTYRGSWSKIEVSHSMGGWYTVTYPTCQTRGVQQNVCSKCGYTEKRYINAKPHTIVKATCTTVAYCSACGETFGTALGHRYEGKITKYPTCVETGIKIYSCVRCSKTKTEVLPLDDHTWGDYTVTTEPTCLKTGVSTSVCSVCSKTQTAAVDPLGHDIVSTNVAATCTAQGYTVNDCQRDGCTYSSITDYTEATGHSLSPNDEGYEDSEDKMELISSVTGICGDDTVDTYQCTHINNDVRCTYTVVIGEATNHNMSDWYTETEATCTDKGLNVNACQNEGCSYRETEETEALGHDIGNWADNGDGTHTKECQREGCDYSETEDCTFGEWTVTAEATCTEDGQQERVCTLCGHTEAEAIEALGHDYGAWTDNGDGTHTKVCSHDESHTDTVEHTYGDGVMTVPPTCEIEGTVEYTCEDCGSVVTEAIDPIGHNYVYNEEYSYSATCTEDGRNYYVCENNPEHTYYNVVSAYGHTMSDWTDYPPENGCGEGRKVSECTNENCDYYDEEYYIIEHNFGDEIEVPGTCITQSYKYQECTDCGYSICYGYGDTDPDNHSDYESGIYDAADATCTEDGYTGDLVCEACYVVLVEGEVIPALGHDYDDYICNDDGTHAKECQRESCGYSEIEDCTFGEENVVEKATCTEDGMQELTCEYCGYTKTEAVPAIGHDWDEGVIDPSSTCNTHGTKTYTCQNDESHTYTEEVALDPENHQGETYVANEKTATCTQDGYTGDTYCADCDMVLEEGEVIPALGHDYGDWYTVTEATCEEDGLERRICKNDSGHIEENILDALGHDWDDGVIDPSSTCNTHGTKTYTCQNDESHTYTEEVALDPENHQGETYVANEKTATCTQDGYTGDTYCADCDTVLEEGEVIPALGHDYSGEWVVTVKADCEDNGTKELSCERCSEVISTDTIIAREHSWSDWKVTKQPTVDKEGVKERECQNTTATDEYDVCDKREAEPIAKLVSYTVTFIAADENGTYEYEGVNYKLVKVVPYAAGTKTIVAPTVPKKTGYIGVWEDYELEDKDIIVKAVYTMESSDEQSEIITEKEVSELKNGVAQITLSAFSEKLSAIVPMGATPYDIVLVLDQSTSMINNDIAEGVKRMEALKATANSFISKVYDSAVKNNVDHRISIVGFSGNSSSSLTGLYANDGTFIHYNNLSGNVDAYEKAYTVVNTQENRDVLTEKINALGNKLGTCANLGLEIAQGVIANNRDEGRKTIVLFITDGEPTTSGSSYDDAIGSPAILNAYEIKNTLDATIYSVGVSTGNDPANCTSNMDKFMHSVSSNYPEAKGINSMGTADALKGYYVTAENEETLDEIFDDVVAQNITNTIPFTKITFFDTVSKYFTLTIKQEEALRDYVYNEYGVTSNDIEITRNADETTTIVIDNITPKAVYDENGVQTGYGASVVFEVSANKNALEAGVYETNTEDAGIEYEGTQVDSFEVPQIIVGSDRYIVEFIVDGETFAITEYNKGDTIVAPDCHYAKWNIGEGTVVNDNYVSFTAQLEDNQKVILWYIDDSVVTQIYQVGTLITPPEVIAPEGKSFESWNTAVPVRMPDENLEFYAIFSEHTHSFSEKKTGSCLDGITVTRICDCGYSESETTDSVEHTLTATITEENKKSVACMTCTLCGYYEEKVIEYKASYSENDRNAVDLTMYKAEIVVQPGEGEQIVVRLYIKDNNKLWSNRNKLTVYRVNENGENEPVTSGIDGSYLVLYLDHFSYFAVTVDGVDEIPTYNEITCSFNGHSYSSSVTPATCTSKGYTTHICTSCGNSYTDNETEQTAHNYNKVVTAATCTSSGYTTYSCKNCTHSYTADKTDALGHNYNSSGVCERCGDNRTTGCEHMCHKSGFTGFIWKLLRVFFKLFKIQPICDCGVAHY